MIKSGFKIVGMLVLLIFIFVSLSKSAEQRTTKKIFTSGKAITRMKANRARFFIGTKTMNLLLDTARRENAQKINLVITALKNAKIADLLIKIPSLNISLVEEDLDRDVRNIRLPKTIGYIVKQEFTVLLKNEDPKLLSQYAGTVTDTVLKNGVNIFDEVVFFKEDDSKEKRETLALAVKDAIANAEVMAKAAGVALGEVTQINSNIGYSSDRYRDSQQSMIQQRRVSFSNEGFETTLVAGDINLTCDVSIECAIK